MINKETWRAIPDFLGYMISTDGRVRSDQKGILRGAVKIVRGKPSAVIVGLQGPDGTRHIRVHRLVLQAFVGDCPDGMEGCHNDGNPLNNSLKNLRWDTHTANVQDSIRHGTSCLAKGVRGESNHNSKLNKQDIIEIRSTPSARGTAAALARKYKTAPSTIERILRRETWGHVE